MCRKFFALLLVALAGCGSPPFGRVEISYWEKWTGFEGEAMQAVVDAFNRSQDRIHVNYLAISQVDRKTLVATAGGDPPDVAGLWFFNVASFADRDALTPLDDYCRRAGLGPEHYLPVYWDMCHYRSHIWALPSTPTTTALHWNKALFRDAGLDPDRPPRTVAELDEFAENLTKKDAKGHIVQLGFLPQEPGWFSWAFGVWFGGQLWDGSSRITCDSEPFRQAYHWVQSYSKKLGVEEIKKFTAGFGNFASPQNPFMSGRIAMVIQGVWMHNYISQYAPGLEYGVGPWPAASPDRENFATADADVLMIPRGARHPDEAFEFIRFVQSRQGMELLCMGQRKNSPLAEVSDWFRITHPHPYIGLFMTAARSPNVIHLPKIGLWQEYTNELSVAFDRIRLLQTTPEDALRYAQARLQRSLDRDLASLRRRGKVPPGLAAVEVGR